MRKKVILSLLLALCLLLPLGGAALASGEMAVPAAFTLLDMAEIMEITATKSRTVVKISPKSRP